MKKNSLFFRSALARRLLLGAASLGLVSSASALDMNVDPYNLGKGDWIYVLSTATNKLGGNVTSVTNLASLMNYEASKGVQWIAIKAGTGSTNFPSDASPQVTTAVINAAHTAGLKIFAYTRSFGVNVPGEISLATNYLAKGCDGFIIDAEQEWESASLGTNGPALATQLCAGIKAAYPTRFLGHAPQMYISYHSSFPYQEFGYGCDAVMPQAYWTDFAVTPTVVIADMQTEWGNWQNSLTGVWTNAIKPIVPAGNAYHTNMAASEITTFVNGLKNHASPITWFGYKGVSWWRADLHTTAMWTAIGSGNMKKTTANLVTNIVSGRVGDSSATIWWNTDISADSVVEYGPTVSYGTTVSNGTMLVRHRVELSGLSGGTTYNYRVKSKDYNGLTTTSANFTFTTLAAGQVNDLIIDNTQAALTGTWTTASSSTDKYGADYRYKGQGTGLAFADFTPDILNAGPYNVYEWHSQGANRGSDTPHQITHSGGTATVNVNQQTAGGAWNLVGNYTFNTGTAGKVRITDTISTAGQLAMADAIKFVYAPAVPTAPSGLSATAVSGSQINLAWTDNSANETSFIVGRSTTSGSGYSDIATLGANTTAYNSTGLSANTTYYYVVRASNAGGSSANSAQASATTLPSAPSAPSGLSATAASSSQINLAWTDTSANETSFIVARSTTSGSGYADIVTLGANVTSYNNTTGLAAGTTYYYVVRASNAGGSSANSAQASATTLPTPPAAPSGLNATTVNQTQISVGWTDNSANETGFTLARSTTSGSGYVDIATVGANTTAYGDSGLTAGTTYYYVVRANNAGGSSANSAQASATTLPNAPTAPSGLSATAASATQINLTWTDNSANETSFIVGRSTVSGGAYTDIATLGANTTSYSSTGLNGSTTYYYVVRASNAGGSSGNSAQASATTLAVADIIVDNLAAAVTGSWSTATSSTDKYATDYRFKSQGTGTAYLTYTPTIVVAGNYQVYELHPQGSNRTTNAPVTVSYNGGSFVANVNQKVNGGTWVAVGSPVNFAAGTAGYVRIADNFSDAGQVVMADAVKLVYVP